MDAGEKVVAVPGAGAGLAPASVVAQGPVTGAVEPVRAVPGGEVAAAAKVEDLPGAKCKRTGQEERRLQRHKEPGNGGERRGEPQFSLQPSSRPSAGDNLDKRQIQVLNSLVDLGRILVAHCDALNSSVFEGKAHGGLTIVPIGELAFSNELHTDDTHAILANLLDVRDYFTHIAGTRSVVIFGIHGGALVIHPYHGDL